MDITAHLERLRQALALADTEELKAWLAETHPSAVAECLDVLDEAELNTVLGSLNTEQTANLLSYLDGTKQAAVAALFSNEKLASIAAEMASDERVDLLQTLGERAEKIIYLMARHIREDIRNLASYAEGSAGAVMTSDYVALKPEMTVEAAINTLRHEAPDKETIYYAYVIDHARKLLGLVSLKRLILSAPHEKIADIMRQELVTVKTDDSQELAAKKLSKYDLLAVPVVTDDEVLVGIITFDDVLDVQQEEATTDFHRMGTVGALKGAFSETPLWTLFLKRIPWLLVLVFVNIFSGAGIAFFEDTIQSMVSLVFFLPLLIDSGGNAGSQSATLMVRALATGEVKLGDWFKMLRKEILVAVAIGLAMALAVSVIGFYRAPEVAMVVTMTMVLVVIVGSTIGMLLPFLLTRFNLDPATASAPLITSLSDVTGVLIYFSIATWYLDLV